MLWTKRDVLQATDGQNTCDQEWQAQGVSINTRSLKKNNLFIALRGPRFNGHDFLQQAQSKGACCVIVERRDPRVSLPQIVVRDTTESLCRMAKFARKRITGTVIGITGSVGKTSVKDTLYALLTRYGKTSYATKDNNNNHYGVPLTLCNTPQNVNYAVIEMGMSSPGEIQFLSSLARPHIAIVTAIDSAHLKFFSSIQDIALAKAEIFSGLTQQGFALYNGDTNCTEILQNQAYKYTKNILTYGRGKHNAARITMIQTRHMQQNITAELGKKNLAFSLSTLGHHYAYNALATLLCFHVLSLNISNASSQLCKIESTKGRGKKSLCTVRGNRVLLYDDSYNSSPASVNACLQKLAQTPTKGKRIAVLGDMLELGSETINLHKRLKKSIKKYRINKIYGCGKAMKYLYDSLPSSHRGAWTKCSTTLCPLVVDALDEGDVIVIKGSLASKMGIIVNVIKGEAVV